MTRTLLGSLALVPILVACGSAPAPEPAPPPAAPPPPAAVAPAPVEAAKPPEPTPEEKRKAEERRQLEQDFAQMKAEHAKEIARWTPELRAEAKALADKSHATGRAALKAALEGKHRKPENVGRDKDRHPIETLEHLGFKPTMTVVEYGPGEGWYTELLAPALAKKGKLIVTGTDPNGPTTERSTLYGQRLKLFLEKSPEAYGKVETIIVDGKAPRLGLEGTVDMVVLFRSLHGMHNNKVLATWLAEFHRALKPNGILGVEQHRAAPDADPDATSKKGYLPEPWLVKQVEAAGFKLAGKSEINANPKDTRDHPEGVWTLPPTLRLKDKDREKYVAIGESDRMTLKFTKVAKKDAPVADATKPGGATTTSAAGKKK